MSPQNNITPLQPVKWGTIIDHRICNLPAMDTHSIYYARAFLESCYEPAETARPLSVFRHEILNGLCHSKFVMAYVPIKKCDRFQGVLTDELLLAFMLTGFRVDDSPGDLMIYAQLKPQFAPYLRRGLRKRGFYDELKK